MSCKLTMTVPMCTWLEEQKFAQLQRAKNLADGAALWILTCVIYAPLRWRPLTTSLAKIDRDRANGYMARGIRGCSSSKSEKSR